MNIESNGTVVTNDGKNVFIAVCYEELDCLHQVSVKEVILGTREEAEEIARSMDAADLPKKRHCSICGEVMDIATKREARKQFCGNNCKQAGFYVSKKISEGDFGEDGIFRFSNKGQMAGGEIEKLSDNQYRLVLQGKQNDNEHRYCSVVKLVDKGQGDLCFDEKRDIQVKGCEESKNELDPHRSRFILKKFFARSEG